MPIELVPIKNEVPTNHSLSPVVVQQGEEVLFEGFLHRVEDLDAVEGMHGNPTCLERGGTCYQIPDQWRKCIPAIPSSGQELIRV